MEKQNADQIIEKLMASRTPVSKTDLRAAVDLVLAQGGQVVSSYDEDGPYCGTVVPGHHVGGLVGQLFGKGYTVKVFPYGIPVINEAFVQIGRAGQSL